MTVTFSKPWLVVVEGPGDKNIIDRLVGRAGLAERFDIRFPGREYGGGTGRGAIPSWLDLVYATSSDFRNNVTAILVIADNDDNPENSFSELVGGFKKLKDLKVGIPTASKQVAKREGFPSLVIQMIPDGKKGALETLCLDALYSTQPIQNAIESFIAAAPVAAWGQTKQSKARLQVAFAGTFEARPDIGLANMRADNHPLPIDHASFNEIVEFLRGFEALIS